MPYLWVSWKYRQEEPGRGGRRGREEGGLQCPPGLSAPGWACSLKGEPGEAFPSGAAVSCLPRAEQLSSQGRGSAPSASLHLAFAVCTCTQVPIAYHRGTVYTHHTRPHTPCHLHTTSHHSHTQECEKEDGQIQAVHINRNLESAPAL